MVSANIKKNNKGMSLVELLVAVAIFVAAIVPMLYAFVYSTGFNFKAQRTMQSTGIAQALIEKCKGSNVDAGDIVLMLNADPQTHLNDSIFAHTNFTAPHVTTPPDESSHTWLFEGVSAVRSAESNVDGSNNSRRRYDVEVTFEPIELSKTDTMSVQSMSSQTANFCNELTRHLYDEDQKAVIELKNQLFDLFVDSNIYQVGEATPLSATLRVGAAAKFGSIGSVSGENQLRENIVPRRLIIDRKIIITADETGVKVCVEYYFAGFNKELGIPGGASSLSYDGVNFESRAISAPLSDGSVRSIVCKGIFTGPIANGSTPFYYADIDNDGTQDTTGFYILNNNSDPDNYVRASACYFYYYPGYVAHAANYYNASFNDSFYLINKMATSCLANPSDTNSAIHRFDFYLFKQYNKDYNDESYVTDTMFDYFEDEYKPRIYMNSDIGGTTYVAAFDTYLHHNFFYNVREEFVTGNDTVKNSYAAPATYESRIDADSTRKCYNCTIVELPDNGYENDFRNTTATGRMFMSSRVLSNEAILPYWHESITTGDLPANDPRLNMYVTRYRMVVNIYPEGLHGAGDLIETMESEILNW